MNTYAQIAVLRPSRHLDILYTYQLPSTIEKIEVGARVKVNFNNRVEDGFVFSVNPQNNYPGEVKPILEVLPRELWLTKDLVELIKWISEYYLCSITEALTLVFCPEKIYQPKEIFCAVLDEQALKQKILKSKSLAGYKNLENLLKEKKGLLKNTARVQKLISQGLIASVPKELPVLPEIKLTSNQETVYRKIIKDMDREFVGLLHGVTGSGKTELYLKLAGELLLKGKQVLFLLPEIGLTTQMVSRVKKYFPNHTLVYHSRLNSREKFLVWQEIKKGEPVLVLGPRSAAFLPFSNLGLIILDEEHELSYKQEDTPKYHTREVVYWRAKRQGVPVLMGTATPSVETYTAVLAGTVKYYPLTVRYQGRPQPKIYLVDMFNEAKAGNTGIISNLLKQKIEERLLREEQVFLFLNRRGFAPNIMCRSCGYFYRCPDCDVALTYHKEEKNFQCHYCGKKITASRKCPVCQENSLDIYGYGTERVEEQLKSLFKARVLRVDYDTMKGKDSYEKIIMAVKKKEVDILIGTQMLAKGFDFPDLTLVGVLNADQSLNMPDFRAGERSFNLLTQVAGRAGRGLVPGEVIIQTFNPENYVLRAVQRGDYEQYVVKELSQRKLAGYPPFKRVFRIIIAGMDETMVLDGAKCLADVLQKINEQENAGLEIIGPAAAPFYKLKRNYRYHILIKGNKGNVVREVLKKGLEEFKATDFNTKLTLVHDLSPQVFF